MVLLPEPRAPMGQVESRTRRGNSALRKWRPDSTRRKVKEERGEGSSGMRVRSGVAPGGGGALGETR